MSFEKWKEKKALISFGISFITALVVLIPFALTSAGK